jgi:uncharacterized RDD family membrane protein YckC
MMEQNHVLEVETRYAGFWIRFLACLLDGIVLTAVTFLIYFALDVDFVNPPVGLQLLMILLQFAYYVVLTVRLGQTLGKMAVGIKVVRVDGGPNGWGSILLRETIGKIVSSLILMIGYIMAAFSKKKQALHDHMARTYVIKL